MSLGFMSTKACTLILIWIECSSIRYFNKRVRTISTRCHLEDTKIVLSFDTKALRKWWQKKRASNYDHERMSPRERKREQLNAHTKKKRVEPTLPEKVMANVSFPRLFTHKGHVKWERSKVRFVCPKMNSKFWNYSPVARLWSFH